MRGAPLLILLLFPVAAAADPGAATVDLGAAASAPGAAAAPPIRTFSVRDEPVEQVLLAFAERTGISIVTDSTVSGSVSVVLHDTDPRETVMQLARAADLIVQDRGGVFWMSRVMLRNTGGGRWMLHSSGAPLDEVVRAIARETRHPVVVRAEIHREMRYPLNLTTGPFSVEELLRQICAPVGAVVENRDGVFIISPGAIAGASPAPPVREHAGPLQEVRLEDRGSYYESGGRFLLSARQTTVSAVLDRLFREREDSYFPAAPLTTPVGTLQLSAPDLETLWQRVIAALDLNALQDGDTWVVAPAGQENRLLRFRARAVVTLRNRPAEQVAETLQRLPGLEVQVLDHRRNLLVIRALPTTLQDALDLVHLLEHEPGGIGSITHALRETVPSEIVPLLRERFPDALFTAHDRRGQLFLRAPEEHIREIVEALITLDQPPTTVLYGTRFLKPQELIDAIGTDHRLDRIVPGGDGRSILLQGAALPVNRTRELLIQLDHPREQLRFDLCIIQYQNSTSRHRGTQAALLREGSSMGVFETTWDGAVRFDQLLSLQFDLLSALGYQAALAVSGELADNAAQLVVDTSLRARDGDTVVLENASTYRYRDYPQNESGTPTQGITREIDSGLEVELTGQYHQDRSVTVSVRVSLSKQGADLSGRGNPPPTSRKVVETTVRVTAGEPIVIGGLLQQEETESARRLPLLGRIPLVRRLVASESATREETEIVLYLSVFPERPEHPQEREIRQTRQLEKLLREKRDAE